MNESKVSTRYAKALFSYAEENKLFEKINSDIDTLISTFKDVENFEQLMFCPTTKTSVKKDLVEKVFADVVSKEFLSFILLVINNKREKFLPMIAHDYKALYKKYAGITSLVITGAKELSQEHKEKIVSLVEKSLNTKIEVETKVDASILGGFILQIDDKQYDASVANKLRKIKKQLSAVNIN